MGFLLSTNSCQAFNLLLILAVPSMSYPYHLSLSLIVFSGFSCFSCPVDSSKGISSCVVGKCCVKQRWWWTATHTAKSQGNILWPFNRIGEMGCTTGLMGYSLASMDSRVLLYGQSTDWRQHILCCRQYGRQGCTVRSLLKNAITELRYGARPTSDKKMVVCLSTEKHWLTHQPANVLHHCAWAIHSWMPTCSSFTHPVFMNIEILLPAFTHAV